MPNRYYTAADCGPGGDLTKCHLLLDELRCHDDAGNPCADCGGEVKLLVEAAWGFKAIREALGQPIKVTSGYRCRKHQEGLFEAAVAKYGSRAEAAKRVAPPGASPHEYATALDCHQGAMSPRAFRDFVAKLLNGDCRLGLYEDFVHFDRAHYLTPNPDPAHFRRGVRWGLA